VREGVSKRDAWRSGFDQLTGTAGIEHAGLRGHVGGSFYTGEAAGEGEIRKAKFETGMASVAGGLSPKTRLQDRCTFSFSWEIPSFESSNNQASRTRVRLAET
jgi:hypothetical protein